MEVEWENGTGQRQSWSSWNDWLCGWYEAEKLLPSSAFDIRVRFVVRTVGGPTDVCKVDRAKGCRWVRGSDGKSAREEFWLRAGGAGQGRRVDAKFELRGPMLHCYVGRAWNAGCEDRPLFSAVRLPSGGGGDAAAAEGPREVWEVWDEEPRPSAKPFPEVLEAADLAAPPNAGAGSPQSFYEGATQRLMAAAKELQEVRRTALSAIRGIDGRQDTQWLAVNSGNTLSAGLGIAAAAAMFVAPPVGIALGVGSAAAGGATTAGDTLADHALLAELRTEMSRYIWNALAVADLEQQWLMARDVAGEALRAAEGTPEAQLDGALVGVVAQSGLVMAKVVAEAVESSSASGGSVALLGCSRTAGVASRMLGVAGAVLSTGIAIHGWSTTKSFQVTVREKAEELESSIVQTQRWLSAIGELECCICLCGLAPCERARRCGTWHYFHEQCLNQWADECRGQAREARCPLCTGAMSEESKSLEDFLTGEIRSQLKGTRA